jgi:hypothetical protein
MPFLPFCIVMSGHTVALAVTLITEAACLFDADGKHIPSQVPLLSSRRCVKIHLLHQISAPANLFET